MCIMNMMTTHIMAHGVLKSHSGRGSGPTDNVYFRVGNAVYIFPTLII